MPISKETLAKRRRMQKYINKKYTKLWKFDDDCYENYNQYISDFGTIISYQGGFLLFFTNDEEENLTFTTMHNKIVKIRAIQSLLTEYYFGKITKKKMLEIVKNELSDVDYKPQLLQKD